MTAAVLAVVVTVALLLRAIRREPVQGDGVGVLAACVITGRASWRICFDSQTSSVQPGSSTFTGPMSVWKALGWWTMLNAVVRSVGFEWRQTSRPRSASVSPAQ